MIADIGTQRSLLIRPAIVSWDAKTKGEEEEEDKRKDKKQKKQKQKKKSRKKRKRKPPSPYRLSHFVAPLYVAPSPTPGNAKPTSESYFPPKPLIMVAPDSW